MPKAGYRRCRICGRHARDVGLMSHTRLCGGCAYVRLHENMNGIHTKSGPAWLRWRRAMAATVLDPALVAALDAAGVFSTLDDAETAA